MFIVNASNRYTIAMTDIEPGNWNYYTMYISRVIHGVMQEMGYSEDQIGQYFKMSGDCNFLRWTSEPTEFYSVSSRHKSWKKLNKRFPRLFLLLCD